MLSAGRSTWHLPFKAQGKTFLFSWHWHLILCLFWVRWCWIGFALLCILLWLNMFLFWFLYLFFMFVSASHSEFIFVCEKGPYKYNKLITAVIWKEKLFIVFVHFYRHRENHHPYFVWNWSVGYIMEAIVSKSSFVSCKYYGMSQCWASFY